MANGFLKRAFDLIIASFLFLLSLPFFLLICLVLYWFNRGKVFFIQERIGRNQTAFNIIKFRTMADTRDVHGCLLPDSDRMTPLGKWIRHRSLDELPQLVNIIKGEMSLVGPRPLLKEYLPRYSPVQRRRHDVRPGITGWAQINGRNSISWEKKFDLDVWYVDHRSLLLDMKILLVIVLKVVQGSGVTYKNHSSMEPFKGEPQYR